MATTMTLMEFIKELLGLDSDSIQLREAFQQDPHATLAAHGLGNLTPEDVHDAMVLVQDNDTVSFDRSYDTGGNGIDWTWGKGGLAPAAHHGGPVAGHEVGREFVTNNHVTNNVDDRDTIIDHSVNQNIHAGGNVNQSFDDHSVNATGDGAVAAGGDIKGSTVTTGNDNVVGNHNHVVHGDGNTTAFGQGSAVQAGDISASHGGAVSIGGDARGEQSVTDSHNTFSQDSHANVHVEDSYNDDSHDFTQTEVGSHNTTEVGSHNHADFHVG